MLRGKYIDYLALGHIHSYKKERLDDRGVYCYSGCLEGRGFDECGEKGFVLLDITEGKIHTEFVPIAKRMLHEVKSRGRSDDGYGGDHPCCQGMCERYLIGGSIKIIVTGETNIDTDIDCERLRRSLDQDFFLSRSMIAHRYRSIMKVSVMTSLSKESLSV